MCSLSLALTYELAASQSIARSIVGVNGQKALFALNHIHTRKSMAIKCTPNQRKSPERGFQALGGYNPNGTFFFMIGPAFSMACDIEHASKTVRTETYFFL